MSESKQTIARLFSAFADALDSMDDCEFDLLIQGKVKLGLVEKRSVKKPASEDLGLEESVSEISQKLHDAESREEAQNLLASINHPRKKAFLLLLAEACSVRATSKENIATIERRLIESVIGSKLREQAFKKVAF